MAERVVGHGSFGVVFLAKCLETGETVAIKMVLQDKRYKNREMQTMRLLDHPNVVSLKHCFFSATEKDELSTLYLTKATRRLCPSPLSTPLKGHSTKEILYIVVVSISTNTFV